MEDIQNSELRENIFQFSLDYLEVYGEFNGIVELVKGLDSDNTNFREFEGFTLTYEDNIKNYEFKVTFFKENIPCFAVYRGYMINEYVETKDYFTAYGSAFLVLGTEYILDFVRDYINFEKVKRFDTALDILAPIDTILGEFKELKQSGSLFLGEGGKVETKYIGQKKRTNKQTLIRIYNKIADIYAKGKQKILAEYLLYPDVTRIEIEFREEISCNVDFMKLYDKKYLLHLFYSYIQKHTDMFRDIPYERIVLKRLKKDFDPEAISSSRMVKDKYKQLFKGYARKILTYSCPVDVLLRNDIISQTTMHDIVLSIQDGKLDLEFYRLGATTRNAKHTFEGNPFKNERGLYPWEIDES